MRWNWPTPEIAENSPRSLGDDMYWPLESRAIPSDQIPPFNTYYLEACHPVGDATMIWGSEVVTSNLDEFIRDRNRTSPVLISTSHLLIKAVGIALREHPKLRRRIIRRRVYQYRESSILLSMQHGREKRAELLLVKDVDQLSLAEIAERVWDANRSAAQGCYKHDGETRFMRRLPGLIRRFVLAFNFWAINTLNLPATPLTERQRCAAAMVNLLSFPGAPPLRSYKPSRFPTDNCLINVTMGPAEERPVVESGNVVVRPVAPLLVRADHRVCDAVELGRFVAMLRTLLLDPAKLEKEKTFSPEPAAERSIPVAAAAPVRG
jgi:hypothetical protein